MVDRLNRGYQVLDSRHGESVRPADWILTATFES